MKGVTRRGLFEGTPARTRDHKDVGRPCSWRTRPVEAGRVGSGPTTGPEVGGEGVESGSEDRGRRDRIFTERVNPETLSTKRVSLKNRDYMNGEFLRLYNYSPITNLWTTHKGKEDPILGSGYLTPRVGLRLR